MDDQILQVDDGRIEESESQTSFVPIPLTEDERLEYAQLAEFYRHDNTIIYQSASIFLPVSFGAIAFALQFPSASVPVATASIILYWYWFRVAQRLSWFSDVRMRRLRKLEKKAGLKHHFNLRKVPKSLIRIDGANRSIRRDRKWMFRLLIFVWIITLLWIHFSSLITKALVNALGVGAINI